MGLILFVDKRLQYQTSDRLNRCDRCALLYEIGSHGALTEKPEDETLHPYGSLQLTCRSNISAPINWFFTKEGSTYKQAMTSDSFLLPGFNQSFMIDQLKKSYDLIAMMTNDPWSYCGEYECVENGTGETATATVAS